MTFEKGFFRQTIDFGTHFLFLISGHKKENERTNEKNMLHCKQDFEKPFLKL